MDYTRQSFAQAILTGLGDPVTKLAVQDIMSWENAEGGHWYNSATFNPLNTTQAMPGSRPINSVGVQAYNSWDEGIQATLKTLTNGRYSDILNALAIGGTQDFGLTVSESPWGTEDFTVTATPTKGLVDPSTTAANPSVLTNSVPPTLSQYPGLFVNSDGIYQIKYSASIGADIANLGGNNSAISAIATFNSSSKDNAARWGSNSKNYVEWVNSALPAIYGPNSATSPSGGSAGALNGLTLSTMTVKDLYVLILVVLAGVLLVVLIAKSIKPAAQAVAPIAALAV